MSDNIACGDLYFVLGALSETRDYGVGGPPTVRPAFPFPVRGPVQNAVAGDGGTAVVGWRGPIDPDLAVGTCSSQAAHRPRQRGYGLLLLGRRGNSRRFACPDLILRANADAVLDPVSETIDHIRMVRNRTNVLECAPTAVLDPIACQRRAAIIERWCPLDHYRAVTTGCC